MELHINEDYIMLNQKLLHEITTGRISKNQTVFYTVEDDQITNYFTDLNDVPGQIGGILSALDLSAVLFAGNFREKNRPEGQDDKEL